MAEFTNPRGPSWLGKLQADFGAALRLPLAELALERDSVSAGSADLEAALGSASAGLATYRRQYWLRLLDVLQAELPLTARLLGVQAFNRVAAGALQLCPPQQPDLHAVRGDFRRGLVALPQGELKLRLGGCPVQRELIEGAAAVDDAYRRVMLAPESTPRLPWPQTPAAMRAQALPMRADARILHEDYPLVTLRPQLLEEPLGDPLPAPARLPRRRAWLLVMWGAQGVRAVPLAAEHAELLQELQLKTLGDALAGRAPSAHAAGQAQLLRWLKRDIQLGIFRDQPEVRRGEHRARAR